MTDHAIPWGGSGHGSSPDFNAMVDAQDEDSERDFVISREALQAEALSELDADGVPSALDTAVDPPVVAHPTRVPQVGGSSSSSGAHVTGVQQAGTDPLHPDVELDANQETGAHPVGEGDAQAGGALTL